MTLCSVVTIMKKWQVFLILLGMVISAFIFRTQLKRYVAVAFRAAGARKTVADRLEEYGETVRKRLLPFFQAADVPYPPEKIVLVGLKQEKKLEVWACGLENQFKLVRTYPILAASGQLGPKLKEGDYQVPEGLYRIESLNPNSTFHLSLKLNYPNDFDRQQATIEGRANLGGDIMIHGNNVSIGCLAMGDEAAEDIFVLAAIVGFDNILVILSPVDLRTTQMPELSYLLPPWIKALYEQIKQEISKLKNQ